MIRDSKNRKQKENVFLQHCEKFTQFSQVFFKKQIRENLEI